MRSLYFDLDGTLTDPKLGITRSIQYAMSELDLEPPATEDLTWCIGPPLLASLESLIGDKHRAKLALKIFRDRFTEIGLYENHTYPDIAVTLENLSRSGHLLYVATSKPTVYATRIIDHFHLAPFFSQIFGSQLDGTLSDKSELLKFALRQTKNNPSETIMIGDRRHDMIGAINNQMTAVGVLYGYGSKAELAASGAHSLVSTVDQLEPALSAFPA